MDNKNPVLITTPASLRPYLANELAGLGFNSFETTQAGISLSADWNQIMLLNLSLRTAHHVLIKIKDFKCLDPNALYNNLIEIKWEDLIDENGYLSVYSNVSTPSIRDSRFANVKCKDAIVDRIFNAKGKRPDSGPEKTRTMIYLYWKDDYACIYLDSSGESLSKRNYRKNPLSAPMQETLAAGLIFASNWNPQAEHFVNPMCGSATLAIEAAMIALNIPSQIKRENFAFMHLKTFNPKAWREISMSAMAKTKKSISVKIIASDINPQAIIGSRQNASLAEVQEFIEFSVCDYSQTPIPQGGGVVMFNPEYGVRLGEVPELENVYQGIGDFLKQKCQGWRGYVFSGNRELLKKIRLKTSRKLEFNNANIECRLNEYLLYEGSKRPPNDKK
jgi:23S rRNA G2445 N2-methylase RlmL